MIVTTKVRKILSSLVSALYCSENFIITNSPSYMLIQHKNQVLLNSFNIFYQLNIHILALE